MNEITPRGIASPATAEPLPEDIERALILGDLGKLQPSQRLQYYTARCKAAGLNPVIRPFEYILLNGRLTLYATKACSDGLSGLHGLSCKILSRESVGDIHEVCVEVSSPSGRSTQDVGAVVVGRLQGEALANARMKAVTKAKRRATLSFCGLGDVIDESELETVRDTQRCDGDGNPIGPREHHAVNHDNGTGHGSGAYANPETVKAYSAWVKAKSEDINAKWLDHNTGPGGEVPAGLKDLMSEWQLSGHLLKWARSQALVHAPDDVRAGQRDKFAAVAWERFPGEFEAEANSYARAKWIEARKAIKSSATPPDRADESEAEDPEAWSEGRE